MTPAALPDVFGAAYRAQVERSRAGETGNECVVCGRPARRKRGALGAGLYIRMDECLGHPIRWDDPATADGGWFPVGTECARRFPDGYVREQDEHPAAGG